MGHVVQGLYYWSNLTELASNHSGIPSAAGNNLTFSMANQTAVKVDNESTIVKPDVLTENGVIHLIDHGNVAVT